MKDYEDLVTAAIDHYRAESWDKISARYYMPEQDGGRSKIPKKRKPEDSRALSVYGDPGWGELVSRQQGSDEPYSQELVDQRSSTSKGDGTNPPSLPG